MKVAIIGAGFAGLAAARALRQAGIAVEIYEKSRRAGGRVATRKVGGVMFDSGAQNIKSQDTELERVLATLNTDERVYIEEPISLRDGARVLAGDEAHNVASKWSFRGGINDAAQLLARDVKSRGARFSYETHVASLRESPDENAESAPRVFANRKTTISENRGTTSVVKTRDFSLLDANGQEIGRADFVISTPPVPQSVALFQASQWRDKSLAEARLAVLERCEYSRCLSVMLRYEKELAADWYGLLSKNRAAPLLWLAREDRKDRDATGSSLVAQLGHETSCESWSEDDAEIAARASELIVEVVGESFATPQSFLVKRWRYSQPRETVSFESANPRGARVLVAGDGVSEGRVPAAYDSGLQAAARIIEMARTEM